MLWNQKRASPASSPSTRKTTKIASATKNNHFAIVAAPADTPEKPKNPATAEMMKNISAHFNIATSPCLEQTLAAGFVPKVDSAGLLESCKGSRAELRDHPDGRHCRILEVGRATTGSTFRRRISCAATRPIGGGDGYHLHLMACDSYRVAVEIARRSLALIGSMLCKPSGSPVQGFQFVGRLSWNAGCPPSTSAFASATPYVACGGCASLSCQANEGIGIQFAGRARCLPVERGAKYASDED